MKNDGWKMSFLLGLPIFRDYVKFPGCTVFPLTLMEYTFWEKNISAKIPGFLFRGILLLPAWGVLVVHGRVCYMFSVNIA